MKKTILALVMLGGGAVAWSQDSLNTDYNTMQNTNTRTTLQSSTGSYNAYNSTTDVPFETQHYLLRDYPSATDVNWMQSGDWYRANYLNSNRNMQVYYAPNGSGYAVALPVLQSWVPEEVVTSALSMYGNSIYSLSQLKGLNGQDVYAVTVIDGGVSRTEYLGADGRTMAAADVIRTDGDIMSSSSSNAAMSGEEGTTVDNLDNSSNVEVNTDLNNAKVVKTKSKVITSDGRQIKTKTKNGKTRVKESAPMH